MQAIHDALRASRRELPAALLADLGPLFGREELLAALSARLLVLGRQGVPADRPPPHLDAECTPPLEEAFAPFRPAVAAWHDAPDSPVVITLLAEGLRAAGARGVLVLLGQRVTPGSVTDARAFPPEARRLVQAAARPHSRADALSVAARALAKHAGRPGAAFWGEAGGTVDERNAAALRLVAQVLEQATWWNVFGHPKHGDVYEVRVGSGHGARWLANGATFVGFVEPFGQEEE